MCKSSQLELSNILYIDPDLKKLYAVHLNVNDYIESKNTKEQLNDYQDYLAHPEKYQSNFHHKVNT